MAADIRAEADGEVDDPDYAGGLVQEWMDTVGKGVPGYVTPKVAVGAAVGNDKGELLLIQRADSGIWLYPTGWCDVGYSAAEVVVKEVEEETGIDRRAGAPHRGPRRPAPRLHAGCRSTRCSSTAAPSAASSRRTRSSTRDVGWFTRDDPAAAARRFGPLGRPRLRRDRRRAARRPLRQRAPTDVAGRLGDVVIAVRSRRVGRRRPDAPRWPPSSPSSPPRPRRRRRAELERIVADPATTLFVARGRRPHRGHADPGRVPDPDRRAGLDRGRGGRRAPPAAAGVGRRAGRRRRSTTRPGSGARTVDLTSRPDREAANRLYVRMGFEVAPDERVPQGHWRAFESLTRLRG